VPAAGILDLKSYDKDTYSAHLQMSRNFTMIYFGINKKYWKKELPEGATQVPTRHQGMPPPPARRALVARGAPGQPLAPIFWYIILFALEKIKRRLLGRCTAVSRWNLGRSTFALRRRDSAGDTSLREGEIVAIDITNDPLIMGGAIFINIFTSTISSQTLVHLLYSIFISNPQIGTCGLLVVLITSCS
jgi:hypothetical protein